MATLVLTDEEKWWREHPAPESTVSGNTLTLWNYPVARTELAAEHKTAIDSFLELERLYSPNPLDVFLNVRGHASPTGENFSNSDLSLSRAQAVRAYLLSLGAQKNQLLLDSAGANEPLNGDRSGFALAQDRRVVIVKFHPTAPTKKDTEKPPLLGDEPKPAPAPSDPMIKGVAGEYPMTLGPVPLLKSPVLVDGSLIGTFKFSAQNPKGAVSPTLVLKDGKFSAKAEVEIVKNLAGKFSIEPPKEGQSVPSIKVSGQFKGAPGKPEIGFQKPPKFAFIKFTIASTTLAADPHDPGSKIEFKGDIKFDIGPGAAMVQRLAQLEASLGGTAGAEGFTLAELEAAGIGGSGGLLGATAAIGGVIAVVVAINGGVIYAVQDAKDEADTYCALLARRDGKSARVAWEILGADKEQNYLERENQWVSAVASPRMLDAFRQGRREAESLLKVAEKRDATVAAWKAKYAADGTTDFSVIRKRVVEDVGGLDKNPEAGASL